jgi:hypothetical protein
MPYPCFSYPADLPSATTNRSPAQRASRGRGSMPGYPCFAYPAICFSYPDDVLPGNRNRGGAQPTTPGVRSMPYPCFRY